MQQKQSGFSTVHILLVVIVLGVIGFAGWFVWQSQSDNDASLAPDTVDEDTMTPRFTATKPLRLAPAELPDGWGADEEGDGRVVVSNAVNGCFTDVTLTGDTAESNSPDVDQFEYVTNEFGKQDLIVKQTTKGTVTASTAAGTKQLEARTYTLAYPNGDATYEEYGFETTQKSYTRVQLSCPAEKDLVSAEAALRAIKFPE